MINDLYNTFDNQQFEYYSKYQAEDYSPNAEWCRGDTATIVFDLNKYEGQLSDEALFIVTFFDFRMEPLFDVEVIPDTNNQIYCFINKEISDQFFNKGIYYCSLQAESINQSVTIVSPEDCRLRVK